MGTSVATFIRNLRPPVEGRGFVSFDNVQLLKSTQGAVPAVRGVRFGLALDLVGHGWDDSFVLQSPHMS